MSNASPSQAPVLQVDGLVKHFPVTRGLIRRKVIGNVRAVASTVESGDSRRSNVSALNPAVAGSTAAARNSARRRSAR